MTLEEQLRRDEGLRYKPYKCTAGKWTVGVGWNISDNGVPSYAADELMEGRLTDATIDRLLQRGMARARADALQFMGNYPKPTGLNSARSDALANMAFNLGLTRLSQFKRMQDAVKRGDWERAADEALDSKWATQVGERAQRIAFTLKTGLPA